MVRLALLLLLLGNVAFFAWGSYFSPSATVSAENHLLQQQINRDSIKLLTRAQIAALASPACMEWGALNIADVPKAEEVLARLVPASKISRRRAEEPSSYWILIPPLPSRQAVQQKTAELKRLGIEEFFVVQDESRFRFAVSLGVFRTEEAARNRLEQLRAQGVRTAQVQPRESQVQQVYLQLRDLQDSSNLRLADLKQEFPGTDVRLCAEAGVAGR